MNLEKKQLQKSGATEIFVSFSSMQQALREEDWEQDDGQELETKNWENVFNTFRNF